MVLTTSFRLGTDEVDKWRAALVRHCEDGDIEYAVERYPGNLDPGDLLPDGSTLAEKISACVEKIFLENEDFSRSFLLRTLESRWDTERLRGEIISVSPMLVRPQAGFGSAVPAIVEAINTLLARLPKRPGPGALGDRRIYALFCANRDKIANLAHALDGLEALKGLHDALQMLQTQSGEWLDMARPEAEAVGPPAALAGLALGTAQAIEVLLNNLPAPERGGAEACRDGCRDAARRIGTDQPEEIRFAIASLRALLIRELPAVSNAMFRVSRDLPLRQFRAVFAGIDAAIVAVVELCDRLRRRLMAHTLWQACDAHVYAIEQAFANPTPLLFADLGRHLSVLRLNLNVLMAIPPSRTGPTAPLDLALHEYDRDLGDNAPETLEAVPVSWCAALDELREAVRMRFLQEGQGLKADIGQILVLRDPLREILKRVSRSCDGVLAL